MHETPYNSDSNSNNGKDYGYPAANQSKYGNDRSNGRYENGLDSVGLSRSNGKNEDVGYTVSHGSDLIRRKSDFNNL